jgi:hypothetical protein
MMDAAAFLEGISAPMLADAGFRTRILRFCAEGCAGRLLDLHLRTPLGGEARIACTCQPVGDPLPAGYLMQIHRIVSRWKRAERDLRERSSTASPGRLGRGWAESEKVRSVLRKHRLL